MKRSLGSRSVEGQFINLYGLVRDIGLIACSTILLHTVLQINRALHELLCYALTGAYFGTYAMSLILMRTWKDRALGIRLLTFGAAGGLLSLLYGLGLVKVTLGSLPGLRSPSASFGIVTSYAVICLVAIILGAIIVAVMHYAKTEPTWKPEPVNRFHACLIMIAVVLTLSAAYLAEAPLRAIKGAVN
ncbi:MAG TPA: hypothetical protein VMV72_08335 [Verrucomicrobiae bacterium]|nr:hypothetical protein [Verrucomicrobiae bacterium]